LGARQRRRRIRERRRRRAYTIVKVTRGETTRTRRVSKKGEVDMEAGESVTQRPSWVGGLLVEVSWLWAEELEG
jgi:hypothetical protein